MAEWILKLLEQERDIRAQCFRGPDYFSGDLSELERHHALVARELGRAIDEEGWPGFLTVGMEGARAATELARYCWSEPDFTRGTLPLLEHGFRHGDVWGDWFAKVYDTVMFFENKPQVYGTFLDWNRSGKLVPWKIVDRPRVKARRDVIQMEDLREYVRRCAGDAENAGMKPPANHARYREALHDWALRRGWKRQAD